jgi:AcrR family transcriptional regulator
VKCFTYRGTLTCCLTLPYHVRKNISTSRSIKKRIDMSPRKKEQNARIKDERREHILLSALKVFSKRGLVATKISDIAAEAGLSHGLLYHYFSSKEDVYLELVKRAVITATESVQRIDKLLLDPLEKIRVITESILASVEQAEEPAYYFFLMIQAYISELDFAKVRDIVETNFKPPEIMLRLIVEGQQQGQIKSGSADKYMTTYWAMIQGLAISKIAQPEVFIMPDTEFLMRLFVC